MKLALGTAQFGFAYGVANKNGQVSNQEVKSIIESARNANIDMIDTAIAYGESEEQLGNAGVTGFNVITKLPPVPDGQSDVAQWMNQQAGDSISRLKIQQLDGLLLHQPSQLLESGGEELWQAAHSLKANKLVSKIGYSIYDPSELDLLFEEFRPDIVQAPYNIIDRRLDSSGWLQKLFDNGVEVHARSVFLQGVLLMTHSDRLELFNNWSDLWLALDKWQSENSATALETCLQFVLNETRIDRAVVGVDSERQLHEVLLACNATVPTPPDTLATTDSLLLNPSCWKIP